MLQTLRFRLSKLLELRVAGRHFDHAYYREKSPDIASYKDPQLVMHYCIFGWREGRDPSPTFSTTDYLTAYPDVAEADINPFVHYLRKGKKEGRDPKPVAPSDPNLALMAAQFDADYYRSTYPDVAGLSDLNLLLHFQKAGWREGRDPRPDFSVERYLAAYPDVVEADINPFFHYLTTGQAEGRDPKNAVPADPDLALMIPHFDAEYYRSTNADIARLSDLKLLMHFHKAGWREGRNPTPDFSSEHYLALYPDVVAADINPFVHYLRIGQAEGREVSAPLPLAWENFSKEQLKVLSNEFDAKFYRQSNEGITGSKQELLKHYIDIGWKEGRNPSADFSNDYYRSTYGDTKGICPLAHFLLGNYTNVRRGNADQPQRFFPGQAGEITLPYFTSILKKDPAAQEVQPPKTLHPEKGLDLHWLVPDFSQGSGGHMTIFRIIRFLEQFGHRSTIWVESAANHKDENATYEYIVKHFQCIEAKVKFVENGFFEAQGDAVIATGWSTAYYAEAATGFAAKYYFVQDHEPEFYPTGAENLLAKQTYDFDLACICASPWLEQIMQEKYGRWSRGFYLAYNHDVYRNMRELPTFEPRFSRKNKLIKIAVYAREHTARRCVLLARMGLEHLGLHRDDFEVHFFGQDDMSFTRTGYKAWNHGILDSKGLAQLYNECDLGLCFSGTNYSLIPQEMMACGLPVIELDTDSTNAIFPEDVVTLVGPGPQSIADGISKLMDDPDRIERQQQLATEWVGQFDWEKSARGVETALLDYLFETRKIPKVVNVIPSREKMLDVVIPTYNGMGEIEKVIDALRIQQLSNNLQIHCIDSSSSDGTTEWLEDQPDVALTVIDQSEFQHGRTRNQAAAQGQAPFIAFLTQDATPCHGHWATDILKMMRHYPQAAGLFGQHLPYPHHCLRERQGITNHFKNLMQHPLALSRDTDKARWESGDRGWRQLLHFYSDNNSAMRRSVWNEIPYPDVDYGEDQLWARTIIEEGYTKLYAPTATVYHSHDFTPEEAHKRCKIEGQFFYEHFGYELGEGTLEELEGRIVNAQNSLDVWGRKHNVTKKEVERQKAVLAQQYYGWREGRLAGQRAVEEAL